MYIYIYIYIIYMCIYYTCTCTHTLHRDRRQQINCLHCCSQRLISSCTCIQVANMYSSSNIIVSIDLFT